MNILADISPAALIKEYIALRDEKQLYEAQFEEAIKEKYGVRMQELESIFLRVFADTGTNSISADGGTVYKLQTASVTAHDKSTFRRHIIGQEAWELVDWRPNKPAITELVNAGVNVEEMGITYSPVIKVGFRRKG